MVKYKKRILTVFSKNISIFNRLVSLPKTWPILLWVLTNKAVNDNKMIRVTSRSLLSILAEWKLLLILHVCGNKLIKFQLLHLRHRVIQLWIPVLFLWCKDVKMRPKRRRTLLLEGVWSTLFLGESKLDFDEVKVKKSCSDSFFNFEKMSFWISQKVRTSLYRSFHSA